MEKDYYTKLEANERFRREEVPIPEVLTLTDRVRQLESLVANLQANVTILRNRVND